MNYFKPSSLLSFFIVSFIFHSCSKEDKQDIFNQNEKEEIISQPEENEETKLPRLETFFTFKTDASFNTVDSDNWVLIHNQDGDLLDYKSFEAGETLIFQALDTVKIKNFTVTNFYVSKYDNSVNHSFESYASIEKGRIWNYLSTEESSSTNSNEESPAPIFENWEFNLKVNNIPNWRQYFAKNSFGFGSNTDRNTHENWTNDTYPNNLVVNNIEVYGPNDIFLSIIDEHERKKYTWLQNVEDQSTVEIDGSTALLNFDDFVEVNIPKGLLRYSYSAYGSNDNKSQLLYNFSESNFIPDSNTIKMDYLNEFDDYYSKITYIFEDYIYRYSEKNRRITPSNINSDKPLFIVKDESHLNFLFETDIEYKHTHSHWSRDTYEDNLFITTRWSIQNPNNTFVEFNEMPNEFTTLYPYINLSDLEYSETTINTQGVDWDTLKGLLFKDKETTNSPSKISESITIENR